MDIDSLISQLDKASSLNVQDLEINTQIINKHRNETGAQEVPRSVISQSIQRIQDLQQRIRMVQQQTDADLPINQAQLGQHALTTQLQGQVLQLQQELASVRLELQRERQENNQLQEKLNHLLKTMSIEDIAREGGGNLQKALTANLGKSNTKIQCFIILPPEGPGKRERRCACEACFRDGECILTQVATYEQTRFALRDIFKVIRGEEVNLLRNKIIAARAAGFEQTVAQLERDGVLESLKCTKQFVKGQCCFGISLSRGQGFEKQLILVEFVSASDLEQFETLCVVE